MQAPARIDTEPGLTIDVAFYPMREVGKDFYLGPTPGASACALATEARNAHGGHGGHAPAGRFKAPDGDPPGEPLI